MAREEVLLEWRASRLHFLLIQGHCEKNTVLLTFHMAPGLNVTDSQSENTLYQNTILGLHDTICMYPTFLSNNAICTYR